MIPARPTATRRTSGRTVSALVTDESRVLDTPPSSQDLAIFGCPRCRFRRASHLFGGRAAAEHPAVCLLANVTPGDCSVEGTPPLRSSILFNGSAGFHRRVGSSPVAATP